MGLHRCFETRLGFGNFGAPKRVFVSFQKQQAILFNDQLPLDTPRPNFWPYHILGMPTLWPATATSATTCCFWKTLKTFAHHRWHYQLSVLHGWLKLTPDKLKSALKTFINLLSSICYAPWWVWRPNLSRKASQRQQIQPNSMDEKTVFAEKANLSQCLCQLKSFTQSRINLSPFTKDFRVWETPIET